MTGTRRPTITAPTARLWAESDNQAPQNRCLRGTEIQNRCLRSTGAQNRCLRSEFELAA